MSKTCWPDILYLRRTAGLRDRAVRSKSADWWDVCWWHETIICFVMLYVVQGREKACNILPHVFRSNPRRDVVDPRISAVAVKY
jgi:hypothetical protein